ncbi:MAG: hypothetical protein ACPGWR_03270 [Ardenticatenaceae bacterium]
MCGQHGVEVVFGALAALEEEEKGLACRSRQYGDQFGIGRDAQTKDNANKRSGGISDRSAPKHVPRNEGSDKPKDGANLFGT